MRLLILVSGGALVLSACGKHDETTTNATVDTNVAIDNGTAANTAAEAGPLTAQGFANAAAASDRFEVESSRLAASAAKLKSTASGLSPAVIPDDTLNPDQQATLDSLRNLKGADFDTAYAAAQIEAHQKALDALNGYAASGDNDALKQLASGMVSTVTAHLNMAKGLK